MKQIDIEDTIQLRPYTDADYAQVEALFLAGMHQNIAGASEEIRKHTLFFIEYVMSRGGPTVDLKSPSSLRNVQDAPAPVPFHVSLVATPRGDTSHVVGFGAVALSQKGAELKRISVNKAFQRRGLGRLIVLGLLRSTDVRPAWLTTLNTMYAARGLYESLGFVQVDTIKLSSDSNECHVVKYQYSSGDVAEPARSPSTTSNSLPHS